MRIFYGVQGTGNGHITRARVMAKALIQAGVDVDFQFTGRDFDKYFDMQIFNGYQVKQGLTFTVEHGEVDYLKTLFNSKPISFVKDVANLDLKAYDVVISDFEPVTAWAAKTHGVPVVGIGHQYAFGHKIPRAGGDPIAAMVMKYFAPVTKGVGLHWHHFGQPILPPIIELQDTPKAIDKRKIIVYLPFEDTEAVIQCLASFKDFTFHIYTPNVTPSQAEHVLCKPLSRQGFQDDFADAAGVISNAGFELLSEALQMGKKILVKPLHAQMEQISNAAALQQLGYGHTMNSLEASTIEHWLNGSDAVRVTYPNTAEILVDWLKSGTPDMGIDTIEAIWNRVDVVHVKI